MKEEYAIVNKRELEHLEKGLQILAKTLHDCTSMIIELECNLQRIDPEMSQQIHKFTKWGREGLL